MSNNSLAPTMAVSPFPPHHFSAWQWHSRESSGYRLAMEDLPDWYQNHLPHLEVVLLGFATDLVPMPFRQFQPAFQSTLAARRIGLEIMSPASAARTYNILASDGRGVLALFLL